MTVRNRIVDALITVGFVAFATVLVLVVPERLARAASKEECIDAHARGQDLREKGQLTRAKQAFLSCAQRSCPQLVEADCARFGDEIEHLVPSISFGARDSHSMDLPATSVYVDDALVATRLDDGKSYDIDPGRHTIRFLHDGKEVTLTPIVNQGEKGRVLVATFLDRSIATEPRGLEGAPPVSASKRSAFPLLVAGLGAAALVTGGVITAVGYSEVPQGCSVGSRECTAAPNDPSLSDAQRAITLANVGLGTAIAGAAVMAGGIVWYLVQPAKSETQLGRGRFVSPWVARGAGGAALSGTF